MGQKVNPVGFRLGIVRGWDSSWYGGKDFSDKLVEDQEIRKYIDARIPKGGISKRRIWRRKGLLSKPDVSNISTWLERRWEGTNGPQNLGDY